MLRENWILILPLSQYYFAENRRLKVLTSCLVELEFFEMRLAFTDFFKVYDIL